MDGRDAAVLLVAGLVAGAIMTFAITYPQPSSVGTFTSVSTTTDTVTAISVSTTTTTSVVVPTETITDAYLSHIGAIVSENATTLAAQYETNATLTIHSPGDTPSQGSVVGSANITRYYGSGGLSHGSFLPNAPYYAANDTYSIAMSNADNAGNVTSHLIIFSYGNLGPLPIAALYNDVSVDISYVLQGDHWVISTESVTFNGLGACATIPSLSPDGNVITCKKVSPS